MHHVSPVKSYAMVIDYKKSNFLANVKTHTLKALHSSKTEFIFYGCYQLCCQKSSYCFPSRGSHGMPFSPKNSSPANFMFPSSVSPRGHISMSTLALIPVCLVIYGCHSCWFGVERGGWCVKEGNLTFIVPFLCSRLYAKHFTGIISCSPHKNPVK